MTNNLRQGSPTSGPWTSTGPGLLGTGPHSRRWASVWCTWIIFKPSPPPHTHLSLWKTCLPQNWSLVTKSLGTTALRHRNCWIWLPILPYIQLVRRQCAKWIQTVYHLWWQQKPAQKISMVSAPHVLIPTGWQWITGTTWQMTGAVHRSIMEELFPYYIYLVFPTRSCTLREEARWKNSCVSPEWGRWMRDCLLAAPHQPARWWQRALTISTVSLCPRSITGHFTKTCVSLYLNFAYGANVDIYQAFRAPEQKHSPITRNIYWKLRGPFNYIDAQ